MSFLRNASKSGEATIVHLTMYGEPWREVTDSIPVDKPAIIVVGVTMVPAESYLISHHNVSVGYHPHSVVAALAVFLDSWLGPVDESSKFEGAQMKVLPSARNKVVISDDDE